MRIGYFLLAAILFPLPALAYIDPGAASILLQVLIGGVAGGLVFLKLYWQRIKTMFTKKKTTAKQSNDEGMKRR